MRKKNYVTWKGNAVKQVLGNYDFVKEWADWKNKLMGIDAGKMGLSGKEGTTMYMMVMQHGKPKRSKSPNQNDGVGSILSGIDEMILKISQDKAPMIQSDLDKVLEYIDDIEDMEDSTLDPRNIPFTVPTSSRGKVGKFPEDPNAFGHYNTPEYRKLREAKGKPVQPEIPDSWWSESAGGNTNPLYQVIFMKNNEMGVVGLIHILRDLEQAAEDATIEELVIRTRYKYSDLLNISDLRKKLANIIRKDATAYLGGKHKNVINQSALLRKVKELTLDVAANEQRYLRKIPGLEEVMGDFQTFKVDVTKAGIMNQLLPQMFKRVGRMKAPNGEPVLFRKPKPQPQEESQEEKPQVDEGEKGANQMKKSWKVGLWIE